MCCPATSAWGQHTLTGYVEDSLGQSSTPVSWTGTVQAPQVVFNNNGSGSVQLDWTGDSGPVILNGGQSYTINGTAAGLTVTLLTSNADYMLQTNGGIDAINAATGVTAVNLMVDTGVNDTSYSMWVGEGHVGNVNLPAASSVSISARGDLWNLDGPSSNGTLTGVTATDLVFANLDGSILGVDAIQFLTTSGWLGTSASQQVEVVTGISNLSAYGVGATVIADARQNVGDAAMAVTVGDGGVPGEIDGGNVGNVAIAGNVNVFESQTQEGNFDPPIVKEDVIFNTKDNPTLSYGVVKKLLFMGNEPSVTSIKAGVIGNLIAQKSLYVLTGIVAGQIGGIQVDNGKLIVGAGGEKGFIVSGSSLGPITVSGKARNGAGSLETNGGSIQALGNISSIKVADNQVAYVSSSFGNVGPITVSQGTFLGGVSAALGNTGTINVNVGNFYLSSAPLNEYLVRAFGTVGAITASGDIGAKQRNWATIT